MRINKEDGKIILEGIESPLAEHAYICGLADAYHRYAKRTEGILKGMIELKEKEEKENGKEK